MDPSANTWFLAKNLSCSMISNRARRGELSLNNVAVTAAALRRTGVQRIAIVDWVCILLGVALALGREDKGPSATVGVALPFVITGVELSFILNFPERVGALKLKYSLGARTGRHVHERNAELFLRRRQCAVHLCAPAPGRRSGGCQE